MIKSIVCSSVVVMLLTGAAVAVIPAIPTTPGVILQYEDFGIGSGNILCLQGADGVVWNTNYSDIIQSQNACQPCSWANQGTVGLFVQDGKICAECGGTWDIMQEALIGGGQMQLIGEGCGPKLQNQGLDIMLGQGADKVDGTGAALANQSFGVAQSQNASNSAGTLSESNAVLVGQVSGIMGTPGTSGVVTSGISVATNQVQAAL
jgi:hypothetical protein